MGRAPSARTPINGAYALACGAMIGLALVATWGFSYSTEPRLILTLVPLGSGTTPPLVCSVVYCANVSLSFTGATGLYPLQLRISLLPLNQSLRLNGSAGRALNLTILGQAVLDGEYVAWWMGDLGKGAYTSPPGAVVAEPNGSYAGSSTLIRSGATLCIEGLYQPSPSPYEVGLDVSYHGVHAQTLLAFG